MNIGCMMSLLRQMAASLAGRASLLGPGIRPSVTAGWTKDDVVGIYESAGYGRGYRAPRAGPGTRSCGAAQDFCAAVPGPGLGGRTFWNA